MVQTIQAARAGSTIACYRAKWLSFQCWREERGVDPLASPVGDTLSFLQLLVDRGLSHATIKVYAAAISSCHEGLGRGLVFAHPLVKQFLQGVRRLQPVACTSVPQWELLLVLEVLTRDPYEPLEHSSLKVLLFKTVLPLALTSAKRVNELCALSVHLSSLLLCRDRSGAILKPNPSFVPKNMRRSFQSRIIHLGAFHPPPHEDLREAKFLCPVHALTYYVDSTATVRNTDQLLVCYGDGTARRALSKKCLARWV